MSFNSQDIKNFQAKRVIKNNKTDNNYKVHGSNFALYCKVIGISAVLLPFVYMFMKGIIILNSIPK